MEQLNNELLPGVQLTEEDIKKFQEIYKKKFDIILSNKEAFDYGIALATFMKASLHIPKK